MKNQQNIQIFVCIVFQSEGITSAELDVDNQRHVLYSTVKSDLCKLYPPSPTYQRAFLKKLLTTVSIVHKISSLYPHKNKGFGGIIYRTHCVGQLGQLVVRSNLLSGQFFSNRLGELNKTLMKLLCLEEMSSSCAYILRTFCLAKSMNDKSCQIY